MNPIDRFWSSVIFTDRCWLWNGVIFNHGYGQFYVDGRRWLAHRYSWKLHHGEIPEGYYILHTCDNKRCINPKHLFLGTQFDNMKDMVSKNRHSPQHGSTNRAAKLTESQVTEIRKIYPTGSYTQHQLADMYSMSVNTIQNILYRKWWKHL